MPTRRDFILGTGAAALALALPRAIRAAESDRKPKLAVLTTVYRKYSHSDHIAGRFLFGYSLDGKHHQPPYEIASMYVDQIRDDNLSVGLSERFGFRHCKNVREALTLGGDKLAVDGVLLIAEHGDYPVNEIGQIEYPRYEMFAEIVAEFRRSGRTVPVFNDKHFSYNWVKAKQMYDWSRELKFPLQAGSSLPVTWRIPELEFPLETRFDSALVAAYSHPEVYGFHALETLQCHLERRAGGETGVARVQAFKGADVWKQGEKGAWPMDLLESALARSQSCNIGKVRDNVLDPLVYVVEYRDGQKGAVALLNGHVEDFNFAARVKGEKTPRSTLHMLPARPGVKYFDALTYNIERMLQAGKAVIPPERTLLVSGILEAALQSKAQGSRVVETPYLDVSYRAPEDSGYFHGPIDPQGELDAHTNNARGGG
jgi:hypothetical protein